MHVALCSAFRNAGAYVDRYIIQAAGLRKRLARRGDLLTLCLGEGDSTDNTRACLLRSMGGFDFKIAYCDHGGPYHGNIVHPERFAQLAFVWSQIWALIPPAADVVLFVESDLIWAPDVLMQLADRVSQGLPAVAPMVWLQRNGYPERFFYDVWAFRRDGEQFKQTAPYAERWPEKGLLRLDSAGSCIAMRGDVARAAIWQANDLIVGICNEMRKRGLSVWLDPSLEVCHP